MKRIALPFDLHIPEPCTQDWSAMAGAGGRRHCAACDQHVHDLARLSAFAVDELIRKSRGHLCGRITRDAHGAVLTAPAQAGLGLGAAAALVSISLVGARPAQAQQGSSAINPGAQAAPAPTTVKSSVLEVTGSEGVTVLPIRVTETVRQAATAGSSASAAGQDDSIALTGVVTDPSGAVIPGAQVILLQHGAQIAFATTNEAGEFRLNADAGDYDLRFLAEGFSPQVQATHVQAAQLQSGGEAPLPIALSPGMTTSVDVTAEAEVTYATLGGAIAIRRHWYQRMAFRLRHPVAYTQYLLHKH